MGGEIRRLECLQQEIKLGLEFVQGSKQLVAERQAELEMLLQTFEAAKLAAQLTAAQLAAIQR